MSSALSVKALGRLLAGSGLTLAVAESCTGGMVAAAITAVPGSSEYFNGGIVAYSNDVKVRELGVAAGILREHGAVSAETAAAMADGVRDRIRADIGLAVTGIAGPSGGSAGKPVGLVYTALSDAGSTVVIRHIFRGTRAGVRERGCKAVLKMLDNYLKGKVVNNG